MAGFILHNYSNSFHDLLWAKSLMTVLKSISTRMSDSMLRSARLLSLSWPIEFLRYALISFNLLNDLAQDAADTPYVSDIRSTTRSLAKPSPYFAMSEKSSGAVSGILFLTRNFRSCTFWQSSDGEMSSPYFWDISMQIALISSSSFED